MNDQIGVGLCDGGQHAEDEADARVEVQPALFAIAVDRLALHVFEDEIRLSGRGDAGIHELRDMGMDKAAEELALAPEPLLAFAAVPAAQGNVQELDGDEPVEAAVASLRQPHGPHSAFADLGKELVGADSFAATWRARRGEWGMLQEVLLGQGAAIVEEL